MTIFKLLQYPDPRLKRKAKKVKQVDEHIRQVIDDMFETHYNTDNCAALAATQLDMEDPPFITVIDFSPNKDQPLCLINGEIVAREGEQYEIEGCMSVTPEEVHEKVRRAEKIQVKALDHEGKPIEFSAEGFMAKCIQHELDHLRGIIYLDRLSKLKRRRIDKKISKIERYHRKQKDKAEE